MAVQIVSNDQNQEKSESTSNNINTNNNHELNNKTNQVSTGKVTVLVILIVAIILLGLFGALIYLKNNLLSKNSQTEPTKTAKNFVSAPDSLGKFKAPPPPPSTPPEPEAKEVVNPTVIFEPPPPLPPQEKPAEPAPTAISEPVDEGPTLQSRRLSGAVSGYSKVNEPTSEVPSRQVKLMTNIDYVLIKGTKIPCTLETNVVSEQHGFTSCIVNQDVYSSNARILLVEKGSKVTGEYNTGLKNGDSRLGIVWDRIITPYDVVIQLNSPSASRLGSSGVTGLVDNRWGTRIGSALLVSLISDTLTQSGRNSKNAEVIVESNTADTTKNMAEKILEKNIDLSPIVYIKEGQMINIYVADDIDLSSIYNVQKMPIQIESSTKSRRLK